MDKIRDKVIRENPNLSIKKHGDKKKIARLVVDAHEIEEGITLCRVCHMRRHWEKQGELLGTPNGKAEGNQQPSSLNVNFEVGEKVQRLTGEDSQPITPTRAPCTA